MPPIADIAFPITMTFAQPFMGARKRYDVNNAVSMVYHWEEQYPIMASAQNAAEFDRIAPALDWVSLARDVLPDSRPMTNRERETVANFFWSQFS